jgi:tetratricopeptide (TPR) repeat protein
VQDRQRAERALRELFGRLAARAPLVLWIDDLQWGDLDSASILASWLDKPIEAPILLVFSYRSEEVTTSSCLRSLLTRAADGGGRHAHEHTISLLALTSNAVEALCAQRLGALAGSHADVVARIVREAQGSPFLAFQLAALAEAKLARGAGLDTLSVGELVEQTGALLPEDARDLLATLAVAGRPMQPKLALRAAGVKHDGRSHLHALRGLNLVRTRDVAGERLVECYHDRVRESVQASLTADQRRQLHENLLRALEFSGQADADWLHSLALGADHRDQALHYGLLAADRANETLAFERAAELYQTCLQLSNEPGANGGELWKKFALALACCGRGARAADAYLEAAKHASGEAALTFTRFAASHLLRSGRFDEGEAQVRRVLGAMDISVPETERAMIAALLWENGRLKLRGTGFVPRKEQDLSANLLAQLDVLDSLSIETQAYDPLRSALFNARGLRMALDAGEPTRVVRALSSAAIMATHSASADRSLRSDELLARAEKLARSIGGERVLAGVYSARAVSAFLLGAMKDVVEPSYEAERLYRADSHGHDYFRRFAAVSSRLGALHVLGEQKRFLNELRATLQEARDTENAGAQLQMVLNQTVAEEVEGQPEVSIARLDRQRGELPKLHFGTLHVLHLSAVMCAASSTREFDWAQAYLDDVWPVFEQSMIRRNATLAYVVHTFRARFALNRYAIHRGPIDPGTLVRDDARVIAKLALPSSKATLMHVRGRVAALRGDKEQAIPLLRQSAEAYAAADRPTERMRDRYALGVLIGGAEGEAIRSEAERKIRASGYENPTRVMQAYYPELLGWR